MNCSHEQQRRTEIFAAILYAWPKRLCSAIRFWCERTVRRSLWLYLQSKKVLCYEVTQITSYFTFLYCSAWISEKDITCSVHIAKGKSFVETLPRMDWLADWPIRFVLTRLRFSLRIACTHTHSQTQQRQTSSWVVCRIQSLCNIVSLELYKLYVDRNPAPPPENIFLRVCIHDVYACITVN